MYSRECNQDHEKLLSSIRFRPRGRAYFRFGTYSWGDGIRELLDTDVVKRLSNSKYVSGMRDFPPVTRKVEEEKRTYVLKVLGLVIEACLSS